MNAIAGMFLLLLIGGLAYVIAFRIGAQAARRRKKKRGVTSLSEMTKPPLRIYRFRAVELQLCEEPCESALALAGKRLLKSEAPALPLGGCTHKGCMCSYTQYDDRRLMERRLMQRRSESSPYGVPTGKPRRAEEDRRKAEGDRRGRGFA